MSVELKSAISNEWLFTVFIKSRFCRTSSSSGTVCRNTEMTASLYTTIFAPTVPLPVHRTVRKITIYLIPLRQSSCVLSHTRISACKIAFLLSSVYPVRHIAVYQSFYRRAASELILAGECADSTRWHLCWSPRDCSAASSVSRRCRVADSWQHVLSSVFVFVFLN